MAQTKPIDILVVEDEDLHWDLFLRNIRKARTKWTKNLVRAQNIAEATELHGKQHFDAVILDLNLPDSTSKQTITLGLEAFRGTPVIVLTSLDDEDLGQQAVKNGAQEFLAKEAITPEVLRRSTRHAIERFNIQEHLEKKNRDLEMFAKMLAHEIRNPLHIVMLTLDRLRGGTSQTMSTEDYQKMITRAISGINDIDSVISELLALALVEKPRKAENIASHEILEAIFSKFQEREGRHFTYQIRNDLSEVIANPQQLKQVFENLIGNAIRYRDFNRPLVISVHSEEIFTSAKFCRVYITDNGIGISPNDTKKIFEPLFRACHEIPREGSGVGLYYCKTAVEKFGGKIDVVSRLDKGTTFILDLPMQEASAD